MASENGGRIWVNDKEPGALNLQRLSDHAGSQRTEISIILALGVKACIYIRSIDICPAAARWLVRGFNLSSQVHYLEF